MNNKATIKSIEFKNFKGFMKGKYDFDPSITRIVAQNGSGKSTFMYAFLWAMGFNVDEVIPSINNKEIPELEISVKVELNSNGFDYVVERQQKEIYKTNKETGIRSKKNNESNYFIDGISIKANDYKEKIAEILGTNFDNLEMLICKEFFNSDTNKWKAENRRKILFDIFNVNSHIDMLIKNEKYELISDSILKGFSTKEIKASLKKERLSYGKDLENNNVIIKDKGEEIATLAETDFNALEIEKAKIEKQIDKLNMSSKKEQKNSIIEEKNAEIEKLISKISKLRLQDANAKSEQDKKVYSLFSKVDGIKNSAQSIKQQNLSIKSNIASIEITLEELNEMKFDGETVCPYCKQDLPSEDIENAKADFDLAQSSKILDLETKLNELKTKFSDNEIEFERLRNAYAEAEKEYNLEKTTLDNIPNSQDAISLNYRRCNELKEEISSIRLADVKNATQGELESLKANLENVQNSLYAKKSIEFAKDKIKNLKNMNIELADKIALCEKKESLLQDFIREQVSLVDSQINSKFSNGVSFTFFNELYKDGDGGLSETCICMLNGKTYQACSTGEKYLADLEVMKVLQNEFDVCLPMFCDNAESFTGDYKAEQQIIELFAKKGSTISGMVRIENIL